MISFFEEHTRTTANSFLYRLNLVVGEESWLARGGSVCSAFLLNEPEVSSMVLVMCGKTPLRPGGVDDRFGDSSRYAIFFPP